MQDVSVKASSKAILPEYYAKPGVVLRTQHREVLLAVHRSVCQVCGWLVL